MTVVNRRKCVRGARLGLSREAERGDILCGSGEPGLGKQIEC